MHIKQIVCIYYGPTFLAYIVSSWYPCLQCFKILLYRSWQTLEGYRVMWHIPSIVILREKPFTFWKEVKIYCLFAFEVACSKKKKIHSDFLIPLTQSLARIRVFPSIILSILIHSWLGAANPFLPFIYHVAPAFETRNSLAGECFLCLRFCFKYFSNILLPLGKGKKSL